MEQPGEGTEALRRLKSTEPPLWLTPSPSLAQATRAASQHLFAVLKPHVPKSPFEKLLVDGFDAEQIWQQIDLQSQPLLARLRRHVKQWEKNPEEIKIKLLSKKENESGNVLEGERKDLEDEEDDYSDDDMDMDGFDDDDDEDDEGKESEGEERDKQEEIGGGGIEDKFLKIKELEEYLEEDEAREYGLDSKNKNKKDEKKKKSNVQDYSDDDEEDEEDEDEDEKGDGDEEDDKEEDDELGNFSDGDDEDEDVDKLENARYEDFFGLKKKSALEKKSKVFDGPKEDSSSGDEEDDETVATQNKGDLSTHEKQFEKLQSEIKSMEKANLEPKVWTMRGEVTAASRPKNSALEVDLDFEHNVRPAPVISEEVTLSIEDMIKNRIVEGLFDDIQRAPNLSSKAPRELKELDETKSKKGLAEVYEEEYVQKIDPAAAPLAFSDEQKKEASMLFKKLRLKLDALSHFHFAPKPLVEDMSIQVNVPALAMEEIAPLAVSDAAMLAPEEVFSGKGDFKEDAELTQEERKRRRAKKKRKFKAESVKQMAKKQETNTSLNQNGSKEEQ
uniref:U3 small nucleolar ribonucleoprotein protein MPP10 n=1 Tax=Rhizophora mucronata TaxID=61149 RepID=A0A2P2JRF4_RHIMU